MDNEIELAEIKKDLKYIKETVGEIKTSVYGNGSKGLKARMIEVEIKYWIILALLVPVEIWMIRGVLN